MNRSPLRRSLVALSLLLAVLGAGCSSPPSQLYLLSSVPMTAQSQAATQPDFAPAGYGSSRPIRAAAHSTAPAVGVAVSVPQYLDRTDIVERTSANEVRPIYSAQWGESLAVTATQAVSDNLAAMLPSDDVMMLPSRSRRSFDYQVNLDLTRFESDPQGVSTLAGRWSILDSNGTERASGRVFRSEPAGADGYAAMAAAMSRNLAAVSGEVADALRRLSAESVRRVVARPSRASADRAKQ